MAVDPDTRIAALTVCDGDGLILGRTREFTVASPHWVELEPLAAAAQSELGLSMTVLRVLGVEPGADGAPDRIRYLVEATGPTPDLFPPAPEDARALRPEPFRMPWARPGGAEELLAWAWEALEARGIRATAPAVQVRSWNLSGIWRLPTTDGTVWLKAVPPFFAHEGAMIDRFAGYAVPRLLARGDAVCLMADAAGRDLYEPPDASALAMIDALMAIQRGPGADVEALLAVGAQDHRIPALAAPAAHTLALRRADLSLEDRRAVDRLISELQDRGRTLEACGIADGLVHGDFHPGNVRGSSDGLTILDWGDSAVGHPLLDVAAFVERMPRPQRAIVETHWLNRWKAEVPGSDPWRALRVIAPIGALRQAVIYRHFLDHIEPDERVYHARDDLVWLERTAALARLS